MIEWINQKNRVGVVSLYQTNMTFNSVATESILNAYKVQIGVDEKNDLIVKPISKERFDRGDIDPSGLYDVAIKKSYSRISSTFLLSTIANKLHIRLGSSPYKMDSIWDEENGYLIVKKEGQI
ncbi:MAG TPA: hypothetical protein DEF61_04940 [Firmicutes bacterium]|nr:hypothetical protein [Bacillota bacterium]HBX25573.1 hypothetical protein [Bacillota bacterium]